MLKKVLPAPVFLFLIILIEVFWDALVVSGTGTGRGMDYYTSPIGIQKLFKVEQQLLSAFNNYASLLEERIGKMKKYFDDYERSVLPGLEDAFILAESQVLLDEENPQPKAKSQVKTFSSREDLEVLAEKVASHPLMTYKLIRRFVSDLVEIEKDVSQNEEKKLLTRLEKARKGLTLPRLQDVNGAMEGILRIQDAYNLDITDFTNGNFLGLETYSGLNAEDCHQIGLYAVNAGIYSRAVEWLERAYRLSKIETDSNIDPELTSQDLLKAIVQHNIAQQSNPNQKYVFKEPIGIPTLDRQLTDPEGVLINQTVASPNHVLYDTVDSMMDFWNFAALCSGKILQDPGQQKNLFCSYTSAVKTIPFIMEKVEVLHENPAVFQIHDVVSDTTINALLKITLPEMSRSRVVGKTKEHQELESATRTSATTWVPEISQERLMKLQSRIQEFTGLRTTEEGDSEYLQVSTYGIGGHYNPHFDAVFDTPLAFSTMGPEDIYMGDRIATFMIYLSDVAKGGATAFPRLGIFVTPKKGSALFWYNFDSDGVKDPLSLHGGCPVLFGTKHVANKWIRSNSQMFMRKCRAKKFAKQLNHFQ